MGLCSRSLSVARPCASIDRARVECCSSSYGLGRDAPAPSLLKKNTRLCVERGRCVVWGGVSVGGGPTPGF